MINLSRVDHANGKNMRLSDESSRLSLLSLPCRGLTNHKDENESEVKVLRRQAGTLRSRPANQLV